MAKRISTIILYKKKCEQSTNNTNTCICTNTSYVYELTGCVVAFLRFNMGKMER